MTHHASQDQPTLVELYCDSYERMTEDSRPQFLLRLKTEGRKYGNADALEAFRILCLRWMED